MSVRVTLSINAATVAGGQPVAAEPILSLRGEQVSIVLAGVDAGAAPPLESWRSRAPKVELSKPITLPLTQLKAAGLESCEALGRFAFSKAFGDDASEFKMFDLMRCSLTTAQQLSRWFGTRDKLVLEPAGSNGDALNAASDNIELVFFFDAHEMIRAWRAAGAAAFDSCVLGGQAADARFNAKAFAKLLGTSEAKVDAALGRQEYAPAPAVATAAIVPFIDAPISLDVDRKSVV